MTLTCRSLVHFAFASGFVRKSLYVKNSFEASWKNPAFLIVQDISLRVSEDAGRGSSPNDVPQQLVVTVAEKDGPVFGLEVADNLERPLFVRFSFVE